MRLILIGGLPAAGKSTVAGLLADRLGAVLLSSDHIRKEMAGISPLIPATGAYRRGIYDDEHTARTYGELIHRADELLDVGETVVLDASWTQQICGRSPPTAQLGLTPSSSASSVGHRQRFDLARLIARTEDASDADSQVADRMALDADPWPDAIRVSTEGDAGAALEELLRLLETRRQLPRARHSHPDAPPDTLGYSEGERSVSDGDVLKSDAGHRGQRGATPRSGSPAAPVAAHHRSVGEPRGTLPGHPWSVR